MELVARIFDSADQARDAAAALEANGYSAVQLMTPSAAAAAGDEDAAPAAGTPTADDLLAAAGDDLGELRAIRLARALGEGKSVVIVGDLVGYLAAAEEIMSKAGALPAEALRQPKKNNPSPFSDFIGLPCLEDRLSFFSGDNPLTDSNWTAFKVVLKDKLTWDVKLLDDPAPLSSKFGMKVLSQEKPWKTSFGFPLLSNQED